MHYLVITTKLHIFCIHSIASEMLDVNCKTWLSLECSVDIGNWMMSSVTTQNWISVVTIGKLNLMPKISPFGISDKNTYNLILMYTYDMNFDFSKFIFVNLMYIHPHIFPSYIRHDVYIHMHIVIPYILYTYLWSLYQNTKCILLLLFLLFTLYYLPLNLYYLPLFDSNTKELYKLFT